MQGNRNAYQLFSRHRHLSCAQAVHPQRARQHLQDTRTCMDQKYTEYKNRTRPVEGFGRIALPSLAGGFAGATLQVAGCGAGSAVDSAGKPGR